jgi:hypothetical protein
MKEAAKECNLTGVQLTNKLVQWFVEVLWLIH